MSRRRIQKKMYAVSKDGLGIIAGTMAYSRKAAIEHFLFSESLVVRWEQCKRSGYRTVMAKIQVIWRSHTDGAKS